jgi:signal transduction histidine kinase
VAVAQKDATAGSRLARCLAEIEQASDRAAALTRQLLAFGRRQEIAPRRLDLGPLVCGLRPMLARLFDARFVLDIATGREPAFVDVDPVQIEHVLLNLAVNARDAMPNGGTLAIRVETVELEPQEAEADGLAAGPHVLLALADSGCGMSPHVRERVFEPFFTTKEHGTGLGLATVYGAVRQNRGAIRVLSEPGRGTTFQILLPRASAPQA